MAKPQPSCRQGAQRVPCSRWGGHWLSWDSCGFGHWGLCWAVLWTHHCPCWILGPWTQRGSVPHPLLHSSLVESTHQQPPGRYQLFASEIKQYSDGCLNFSIGKKKWPIKEFVTASDAIVWHCFPCSFCTVYSCLSS